MAHMNTNPEANEFFARLQTLCDEFAIYIEADGHCDHGARLHFHHNPDRILGVMGEKVAEFMCFDGTGGYLGFFDNKTISFHPAAGVS